MKLAFALLAVTALSLPLTFEACSTSRPTSTTDPAVNASNATANAHGAAVNRALADAAKILGKQAVSFLASAVSQEAAGGHIDYVQSAAAGLEANVDVISTVAEIEQISKTWSGGNAQSTAYAAADAFGEAISQNPALANATATQAIANVIFAATGAPPAPSKPTVKL